MNMSTKQFPVERAPHPRSLCAASLRAASSVSSPCYGALRARAVCALEGTLQSGRRIQQLAVLVSFLFSSFFFFSGGWFPSKSIPQMGLRFFEGTLLHYVEWFGFCLCGKLSRVVGVQPKTNLKPFPFQEMVPFFNYASTRTGEGDLHLPVWMSSPC